MESIQMLALMLLAVHWLLDYLLQGDFLSTPDNQARCALII